MQNKATVTYYLMCDNRRKVASRGYLSAEMGEGSTGAAMQAAGMQLPAQHFGALHGPAPTPGQHPSAQQPQVRE